MDKGGASTSAAAAPAGEMEDDVGGEEDLQLAWEVADMARVVFEKNSEDDNVTIEALAEVYELLGDIGAERDSFEESVADYEKVRPPELH
jgi:hypothetical protein